MSELDPSTLLPSPYGMSRSTGSGDYKAGERVIGPDDNLTVYPTDPVFAFSVPTPHTHGWAMNTTAHNYIWGSSDFGTGAGGNSSGFDEDHPNPWTIVTGVTTTGHVAVGPGGGVASTVFSATSGRRVFDVLFKIPILSTLTERFYVRLGYVNNLTTTPTNGIYLEIDSSQNVEAEFITVDGGVENRQGTGFTFQADTWYRYRSVIYDASIAQCFLLPESTILSPDLPTLVHTSSIPSGTGKALQPCVLVKNSGSTSTRALTLQYFMAGTGR